ncbi:hypothetical protein EYC84_012039 [Monilinia fructicola]|uniref:Apple domain-containing protein n=1 Tax=Monilinia fructicola TaxID=38448 RepID=A0A5M9J5T2_MONFR|nr:hypothetical protein EYC84_012039 [Monilinia fructicola]
MPLLLPAILKPSSILMPHYDVAQCGALCDKTDLCTGFNIYVERDPSVNPSDSCSNPASITNYKCTLWGSGVDSSSATNNGQWRDGFQVVITGSNGYEKEVTPPAQPGWQPPQQCGGGTKGHSHPSTCLGQSFFPGPYNPALCAGYAVAQNKKNLSLVSSWMQAIYKMTNYAPYQCKFFNSYMLEKNGKPMGTYLRARPTRIRQVDLFPLLLLQPRQLSDDGTSLRYREFRTRERRERRATLARGIETQRRRETRALRSECEVGVFFFNTNVSGRFLVAPLLKPFRWHNTAMDWWNSNV